MHFLLYHRDIKLFLLQLLTSLLATVTLPVALIELGVIGLRCRDSNVLAPNLEDIVPNPQNDKKKQREEETNSRLVDPPTSLMLQPHRKQKGRKEGDASVLHLNEAESFRATAPFMYQQCASAGERKSFRTSVLKRKKIKLIPTCLFIGQNDTNRVTVLPAARFP